MPNPRITAVRWLSIVVAAIALAVLVAYAAWPWWSAPLLRIALAPQGISVEAFEADRPTPRGLFITAMTLRQQADSYALRIDAREVTIGYGWAGLRRSRLDTLHAASVDVMWQSVESGRAEPSAPLRLELPSTLLRRLPVAQLELPLVRIDARFAAPVASGMQGVGGPQSMGGPQQFAGSARFRDGVLTLDFASSSEPPLRALATADVSDRLTLGLWREQTPLLRIDNSIDGARNIHGSLLVQTEPLHLLLREWGVVDADSALSGTVEMWWRGPLPATLDRQGLDGAALTGTLAAALAGRLGEAQAQARVEADLALANGIVTAALHTATASAQMVPPASVHQLLGLPVQSPLHIDAQTTEASVRVALQPLAVEWSGNLALSATAKTAASASLRLRDGHISYRDGMPDVSANYHLKADVGRLQHQAYHGDAAQLELAGSITTARDGGTLSVERGASLKLQRLQWAGGNVRPLTLRSTQPLTLVYAGNQLRLADARLTLGPLTAALEETQIHAGGAEVRLRDVALDLDSPDAITAGIEASLKSLSVATGAYRPQPLDLSADLKLARQTVAGSWRLQTPSDLFTLRGTLRHGIGDGRGKLQATLSPLSFREDGRYLPALFVDWPHPLDFSGGQLGLTAQAQWRPQHWSASLELALDDLAGFYQTVLFKGLTTNLRVCIDDSQLQMPATPIALAQIDAGIALRQLQLSAALAAPDRLSVRGLQVQLLGGRAQADDFEYRWQATSNTVALRFEAIDLHQLLTLEDNTGGSGILDGFMPVTLDQRGVSIIGGRLAARPPGGVVQYRGELPQSTLAAVPALQLAIDSLKNFHFTTLTADADYQPEGDLLLRTVLRGRNPDLAEARPVHFNLNIRENVPDLLRSIRLSRDIGDNIERRIQDFYQRQSGEPH